MPGSIGLGTTGAGKHAVFAQGKLVRSGGAFDVAIDGPGFFRVERGGARRVHAQRRVRARSGRHAAQQRGLGAAGIRIPADALAARVERDGRVAIDTPAANDRAIAHLRLASFASPEALRPLGATLFAATDASGPARLFAPGGDDGPRSRSACWNVRTSRSIEAMMQILGAQRAYEANAKGVQAADEMLRIANNLHRG